MLPTPLARFREIDDRSFAEPHSPSSISLSANPIPAATLRAVLARLRADALPAAGLSVVPTASCGWTALMPYCDGWLRSLMVRAFVALENGSALWSECRRTSTLRHRLATGLAIHRSRLTSLEATCAVATALKKTEFGFLPHQSFSGLPCPGSGYDVPTASMPSGTLGMIRRCDGRHPLERSLMMLAVDTSVTWPCVSVASAHHPLARLRPHDGGLAGLLKRP
jgi:hypothetical protein